MRKFLLLVLMAVCAVQFSNAQLILTGVYDCDLSGGTPKGVELYATEDIADLSIFTIAAAFNGADSYSPKLTLEGTATSGDYIYVSTDEAQFNAWFGFNPTFIATNISINGDDGVALLKNDVVFDTFGELGVDGTGQTWEYKDGWAYRINGTGPDATFNVENWTYSGVAGVDGETSNATAENPVPISTFEFVDEPAKEEPSNHVLNFAADDDAATFSSFTVTWTENDGEVPADGYLLVVGQPTADKKVITVVDGTDMTGDLDLSDGEGNIKVSNGTTSYTFENCAEEATYSVSIYPYTNSGDEIDYKTDDVPTINASTIAYQIPEGTLPYSVNFNGNGEDWSTYSVIGDQTWSASSYGGTTFMKITGYKSGTTYENEDWLISPKFDLSEFNNVLLSFSSAYNYSGNALQLMVSTDYDGIGNPNDFTWVDLSEKAAWSTGGFQWMPSGYVQLANYTKTATYIAFKFTCSTRSSTWEVTDIELIEAPDNVAPSVSNFSRSPYKFPTEGETVTVSAKVVDEDQNLEKVELMWGSSNEDLSNVVTMERVRYTTTYSAEIPAQSIGTSVFYKVVASDELGSKGETSVKDYTVTQWTDVATLADLRTKELSSSTVYKFTGKAILTYFNTNRYQRYIQDETAAILIDDYYNNLGTSNLEGIGLTNIVGTLSEYKGMLQFVPIRRGTETKAPKISVQEITIADLNGNFEMYESEILLLKQVSFESEGVFTANTKYTLNDFSGSLVFRTNFNNANYIDKDDPINVPTYVANIVGIAIEYDGEVQFTARKLSDFRNATSVADFSNEMKIYVANRSINISNNSAEAFDVVVYNLAGQKVAHENGARQQAKLPISKAGVYMVRVLENGTDIKTQKVLIQ